MSVQELTLKVLGLETELEKVKKKYLSCENNEGLKKLERSDGKGVGKDNKRNAEVSQETPDVKIKEVANKIDEHKKE